jgi:hypothetical protein
MSIDFSKFCVGKRGKSKVKTDYGIKDFYKYYKETVTFKTFTSKYSQASTGLIVDEQTYYKIIKEYFKLLAEELLKNPDGIPITPMGILNVTKRRMDFEKLSNTPGGLKIDYKTSKEKGMIVYHLNEHRSYCSYRFGWKRPLGFKFARAYMFKPTRQNKRELAKRLTTDLTLDFFETS